jgi:hypothetical protein
VGKVRPSWTSAAGRQTAATARVVRPSGLDRAAWQGLHR